MPTLVVIPKTSSLLVHKQKIFIFTTFKNPNTFSPRVRSPCKDWVNASSSCSNSRFTLILYWHTALRTHNNHVAIFFVAAQNARDAFGGHAVAAHHAAVAEYPYGFRIVFQHHAYAVQ